MDTPQETKPKKMKNTLIAAVAIIVVIIIVGSVVALDYNNLVKAPSTSASSQEIFVYAGPSGTNNSEHLLGGDVLGMAAGANQTGQYAMAQFMAYMMSPAVQQEYMVKTGFLPVSNSAYTSSPSSNVTSIYSKSNASVSITYYDDITPADAGFVKGIISNFEGTYTNIHVSYVNTVATSILSAVEADVTSANGQNIVVSIDNLDIGSLVYGHYMQNINTLAAKINPSGTIQSITNLTNYETTVFHGIFFLTERANIPLVWINYSAMTKAGIKSAPTTNAQLLADAQTLYKYYGTGMINFQGHGGASTATELYQWFVQDGGNPMVFNSSADIHSMEFIYNLSKYFSPEYKTSYWATYKGLASNKYSMMDYQWPGSVNLTALGMKAYNSSDTATNASLQAMTSGVFLRTPVPWIGEWQTLMDNAWTSIIVNGGNYTSIPSVLSSENSAMYNYLLTSYNYTVATNYASGDYQPIVG